MILQIAKLTSKFSTYDRPKFGVKFSLTLHRPAMPFGNRKKHIVEDLFGSVLSKFKNIPHRKPKI